ncbi:Uncharacterised protein g3530 [Pycnogonum litorale]
MAIASSTNGWIEWLLSRPHSGIVMTVVGGISYGSANFIQKLLTKNVHPMETNLWTFTAAFVLLNSWLAICRTIPKPVEGEWKVTIQIAVFQTILLVFQINSLRYIPAFNETVLFDSSPAFAALLSWIFLKERIRLTDVFIMVLAFVGVVLVSQPSFLFPKTNVSEASTRDQLIGSCSALTAALFMGLYACTMRTIPSTRVTVLTFYSFLFIMVVSLILGLSLSVLKFQFTRSLILGYVGAAVLYNLNFNLVTKALKTEKAVYVAVTQSCDLPTVLLLQTIVSKVYPNYLALLGATCVVTSILLIGFKDLIYNRFCSTSDDQEPLVSNSETSHPGENNL